MKVRVVRSRNPAVVTRPRSDVTTIVQLNIAEKWNVVTRPRSDVTTIHD